MGGVGKSRPMEYLGTLGGLRWVEVAGLRVGQLHFVARLLLSHRPWCLGAEVRWALLSLSRLPCAARWPCRSPW
jgi:hypothetical protein